MGFREVCMLMYMVWPAVLLFFVPARRTLSSSEGPETGAGAAASWGLETGAGARRRMPAMMMGGR